MALFAAGLLFLALPASEPLWSGLPLIRFVQFPWRLVGRAALPVAFLAGVPFGQSGVSTRERQRDKGGKGWAKALMPAAGAALLLVEALPLLYPSFCAEVPFPAIGKVHAYERESGMVAIDPTGSYFPRTVEVRPAGSPMETDYAAGVAPERFDRAALPDGAAILEAAYRPTQARVVVESPQPFTARYLTFAFPGWVARVDGEPVAIRPSQPEGVILFDVPAGRHTVEIGWHSTPLRSVLGLVSIMAAAGVAAVAVVLADRQAGLKEGRREEQPEKRGQGARAALAMAGVGLLFLAFKVGVVDRL
jgi:hypothetical protein